MTLPIHINCDLGEGAGNDDKIMPYIQACNIACGGHYGDVNTIRQTVELAQKFKVEIGAHPSFPDRENFGRVDLNMPFEELRTSILSQVRLFQQVCSDLGVKMSHIKLHGALYNLAAKNPDIAELMINTFKTVEGDFTIYAPYKSELAEKGKGNFKVLHEAFIDRTYQNDLRLTPRSAENALIKSPQEAWNQLSTIWQRQKVQTTDGNTIRLQAETFCIHGDSTAAVDTLAFIHSKIKHG